MRIAKNNFATQKQLQRGLAVIDAARAAKPDILIEDDCESIGGKDEMISPKLDPELGIKVITTREFGGIDHLPDDAGEL